MDSRNTQGMMKRSLEAMAHSKFLIGKPVNVKRVIVWLVICDNALSVCGKLTDKKGVPAIHWKYEVQSEGLA